MKKFVSGDSFLERILQYPQVSVLPRPKRGNNWRGKISHHNDNCSRLVMWTPSVRLLKIETVKINFSVLMFVNFNKYLSVFDKILFKKINNLKFKNIDKYVKFS